MALLLLSAFITGALTIVIMEAVGLWILIRRLTRKVEREEIKSKAATSFSSPGDLNPSLYEKQLFLLFVFLLRRNSSRALWVLEPDKVPKSGLEDKVPTEQRRRKEISEVTPVRKYARIRDHYLILLESDGSCVQILLNGCTIVTVSGTKLGVQEMVVLIHITFIQLPNVSFLALLNLIALHVLSCNYRKVGLNISFLSLISGPKGYPSFMKPSAGSNAELVDKSVKIDNSSSKVRQFLKKLTKKASKRKPPKISYDDSSFASSISTSSEPGGRSDLSRISDADSSCKYFDEEHCA
ncbi:hypothetical protein Sango_1650000 [Sesamum angolense]|uniref:SMP domain-containing protein n=1 Tax=Sesamum angolense TaxID=2727404 RepID=A0AAE1WKB1_9LAMI|nr:hypothetical protein Sango_1650000 [Sesamum angolense]